MDSIFKNLPAFGALTEAEAWVFEDSAESREFAAGSEVPAADSLVLATDGVLQLGIESGGPYQSLGTLERGGLLGEMNLFEADPVPIRANADRDTTCLSWRLQDLKSAFRYSRTGAAKLMAVFSMSLSQKIRLANELLRNAPESAGSADARPRELDALDLQRLRSFSVSRDYAPGTVILEEGDVGRELFVIADGEVEILKETDAGTTIALARLKAGDFFGEMAFVDESPRSATAVARTRLHVHVLPSGVLDRVCHYNVGTALYFTNVLCKIMTRRLDVTLRRIASL